MQHILSMAKVSKVCYSLAELCQMPLFEFIRLEGEAKFMKHFKGGNLYNFGNLWFIARRTRRVASLTRPQC
jgi:hypothetical protein